MLNNRLVKLLSIAVFVVVWQFVSLASVLVPSPLETLGRLAGILCEGRFLLDIAHTLLRGLAGLAVAGVAAFAVGIPCGLSAKAMAALSPLVTLWQGCPPIVWLSLLLVWLGSGAAVPVIVVIASTFPVLFFNISKGTAALDRRYFEMAALYRVPRRQIVSKLILPGISTATKSAFTFAIGVTWKVTSTAEFFSAENGIGARIQQSYQRIDMPSLFAWTLVIALIGLAIDSIKSHI